MKLSKKLNDLIKVAIEDGELDDKERAVLFERAKSEGVNTDEFDIYINSRLNRKIKEQEEKVQMEEAKEKKGKSSDWPMVVFFLMWFSVLPLLYVFANIGEWIDNYKVEKYETQFHEALNSEDFVNAYNALDRVKGLDGWRYKSKYEDLRDEIVRKEITYLVSLGDEQSSKRIIYLLAQYYDSESDCKELKKDLYELAKKVGNEYAMSVLEVKEEENE